MPDEEVLERSRHDKEGGKSPSTQAGEFVREEMHHIREGKHGAQSPQAIAIGLSKARGAGVALPSPKRGTSAKTCKQARRDTQKDKVAANRKPSRVRSRATLNALRRKGHSAASPANLSMHARTVARRRASQSRYQSAEKAILPKEKQACAAQPAGPQARAKENPRDAISPVRFPRNDRGPRRLVLTRASFHFGFLRLRFTSSDP